jgi:hypothetical protein
MPATLKVPSFRRRERLQLRPSPERDSTTCLSQKLARWCMG